MEQDIFRAPKNSRMMLGEIYFWTNTIKDWKHLLKNNKYKHLILDQLQWLISRRKIAMYGYVLMPNHIHFMWEMLEKNGKEMPHASFNKWTSSNFLKDIRQNHPQVMPYFTEPTEERQHRFWQKELLAILTNSRKMLEQKLDYIHQNPLQERWNLTEAPELYKWSSAAFYETGMDEFKILTHYKERL